MMAWLEERRAVRLFKKSWFSFLDRSMGEKVAEKEPFLG